jgi:hypothetical protein
MNYTFCILILLIPVSLLSQSDKQDQSLLNNIPVVYLNLNTVDKDEKISLPFKGFKLMDYRNDTSVAGITNFEIFTGNGRFQTKCYKFKNGAVKEISNYINTIAEAKPEATFELAIVFRKIWIGSEFENKEKNEQDKRMQKPFLGGVRTTFEFYAYKEGKYVPLKKFDTTISDLKMKGDEAEEYLQNCITASLTSVSKIDIPTRVTKGKRLSFETVDSFSTSQQKYKVFTERPLVKGVYLSYEEFKNNNPGIKDYEIKKSSQAHTLYVKDETGTEFPLRKIWGFCDGERIYIQGANAYFELEYLNHTFYCYGAKKIFMTYAIPKPFRGTGIATSPGLGGIIGQSLRQSSSYKLVTKLMQLDLETGILY